MKYFRSNDKIYETKDFRLVEDERFGRRYVNKYNFPFVSNKEANTIEELCDMFVVINDDWGKEPYCCTYVEIKLYKNLKTKGKVYGAIWTDKGLIYVAKMNEKGELELL